MGQTREVRPLQRFVDSLNEELFHIGEWRFSLLGALKIVLLPILAFVVARYVRKGVRLVLKRAEHLDPGVRAAITSVTYYTTLVLGLVIAMDQVGVDVTSLAVFTGAMGVGIGLGLQDFAKNFIAGLIMMGTRPVKPGDRVEFGGLFGVVRSIGSYSTVLETIDHSGLVVPNSVLLNERVVNRSFFRSAPAQSVTVRFPHSVNLDSVLADLRAQYSGVEGFDTQVTAVTEAAVEVRVTVPVDGAASMAATSDEVFRRVVAAMAKNP